MNLLKQEKGFYSRVLGLMLPMIIQNFVSNTMTLADTFMVGLLGETQLAAVAAAATPFFIVMLLCFGLQSGASVLASQYHGKGDTKTINRILGIGWMASLFITVLIAALTQLAPMPLIRLLTNNEELYAPGIEYIRIIGFSYIFFSFSGMYTAIQRALGNPKFGAYVFTCSGLANVFLNWVLIFGKFGAPALGISGAAIATVISRMLEVAAVLVYMNRSKIFKPNFRLIFRPGKLIAKDFLRIALPVGVNELLWSTSVSVFSIIMGHMAGSTAILAAHTLSGNIERLISVAIFAVGHASAIIVGSEIGKGNLNTVYSKAVALNFVSLIVGIVAGLLTFLIRTFIAGQFLFPAMGLGSEAQGIAMFMLGVMIFIQPMRALNMSNIVGVFRGGGDVVFALISDVVSMYVICIPAAAICGIVFKLGIIPVFICLIFDEVSKFFITQPRLHSKKWIKSITRESPQEVSI